MSTSKRGGAPKTGGWKLPNDLTEGTVQQLDDQLLHEGVRFANLDASGMDLSGSTFEECDLDQFIAHEAKLQGARLLRTRVRGLNAPVLPAPRSALREVRIESSRLGAAELYEAELDNVVISGCKITWLNLRSAKLKDVLVEGCVIEELDLGQARAERVSFENTRVGTILFGGARMRAVDLRGLEMGTIGGLESLRGTVVTRDQFEGLAQLFADHFGMTVSE